MNKAERGSTFLILMVDDDPMLQKVGRAILEHCGCRVDVSESGREAVDAFARQTYAMIFMDCHMPGMDGYETTGVIRAMENDNRGKVGASRVPIVALTGYSTEEDRERCLQAGMDDYLSKPFSIARMQSVLDRWLFAQPKEHRECEGDKDSACIEMQDGADGKLNRQEEPPPIDRNSLDVIASLRPPGSENILGKVISLYLDSSQALMKSIREAVEGRDFDALHRAAHTLKSSSAYLGALAFSGMCKELETMGRDKTLEGTQDRLSALEHEYTRVRESLERHRASLL
jgi:two-component system, sensor histidine kinase and response regulator